MARKRMIDPSFWEDEKLGTINPMARLLFMGLISQADDEGRLKGHPSLLRSLIFPYDDEITLQQIDTWLGLLGNLIQRYEMDSQKYIWIRNFKKHQTINKPQESKLPALPDNYSSGTVTVPEYDGSDTAQKKLIEEKLKEEEEKRREGPSLSNPHENLIQQILIDHQIDMDKPYPLEQFFSYIGAVDLEVMEAAIKKSKGKRIAYCLGTLEGMVRDGITKADHLRFQVVKGGQANAKHGTGHDGRTDAELNALSL